MLAIDGTATAEDLQLVLPTPERQRRGPVAVIECFQEIPCNPCADACPRGAITMPENISQRPAFSTSDETVDFTISKVINSTTCRSHQNCS